MKVLEIKNVEKYYGNKGNITKAVDNISFDVESSEFIAIMGASGSGKTTLLNCISTIDTVSAGNIFLNNENLTELVEKHIARFRRENLGFIFQDYNLLDTLTIEENIGLVLTINQKDSRHVKGEVEKMASLFGIGDILNKFPYQVSGGQKQRCACARALINNQKIILADEPTGALDSQSSQTLLEILCKMNKELTATILMVTHDSFSASYAQRILFLKDGKIFNELIKGDKSRRDFYNEILDVLSLLGGDMSDAR